ELPGHRDGHEVRHVDRGAELLELDGADESEDEPDQKADEADDAERAWAAVLDDDEQIADPEPRPAADQRSEREHSLTEERNSRERLCPIGGRPIADPRQPRSLRAPPGGLPLGTRLGKMQETLDPVGEPGAIAIDSACPCLLEQSSREGDEARIPLGDTARIEAQPTDGRIGLDLMPYLAGVGYLVRVAPCAGQLDTRDVGRRTLDVHGPRAPLRGGFRISPHAPCPPPGPAPPVQPGEQALCRSTGTRRCR